MEGGEMLECETFLLQQDGLPSVAGVDFSAVAAKIGLTGQVELAKVVDDSGEWFITRLDAQTTKALRWFFNQTSGLDDEYKDLVIPADGFLAIRKVQELDVCHRIQIWWREGEAVAIGIWGTEA